MHRWLWGGVLLLGLVQVACESASPTAPTAGALSTTGALDDGSRGAVTGLNDQNSPPALVFKTTPPAVPGNPHPVVSGDAPLTVKFNLCGSSDPEQDPEDPSEGDTLNWQFHFGDSGTDAFNPDGTFNADFARSCRTEHTYSAGRYVATVSVTDKHLEDQGGEVAGQARMTQRLTIVARGSGSSPGQVLNTPGSITTLFASNNQFAGNTFDLQASVPLRITGFDVHLVAAGGTHTVAVYWRPGTANGAQGSAAGWTLLGTDAGVVSSGANNPSSVNVGGLTLTPGQVYGIYVDLQSYPSTSLRYTNGGPTVFSNADLSLTTLHGKGNPAFTGTNFFPRQWNGTVYYVK
jgi:hypothetical protein